MKNISRWYGIEGLFEGDVVNRKLGGTFPINRNLDDLLGDQKSLARVKFVKNGKEVRTMS